MCDSCGDENHVADIGRRAFLNKPGYHSIGAIASNVNVRLQKPHASKEWHTVLEGTLTISDCQRTVVLDLCAYRGNEEEIQNCLYKLDEMARVLNETRQDLTSALKAASAKLKRKNKKKEDKE